MPENPPRTDEPVEVRTIRHLVRLMKQYDLTAIDFIEGQTKIRLRRRGSEPAAPGPGLAAALPASYPGAASPAAAQAPRAEAAPAPTSGQAPTGVLIESPMVGTYYASSAPDAPPFVMVGATVRPDTTVCVIEAMKVFTDIPAGVSGTITEVLVKNGQSVEFGQPMFRVNPA
jgi:acetyl-CoA carboxylase biotin carboxyl carrier protein